MTGFARASAVFVLVALGLAACGQGGLLGGKDPPDEFSVVSRAPLTLPPDFGLRPPRPGAKRPNEITPREEARSTLLRNTRRATRRVAAAAGVDGRTPGERALLSRAGALDVDPEIRYIIERESGRVKEKKSLVDKLVFWRRATPPGLVVDPVREAERLRENAALGKPPTEGKTPLRKE